MVGMEGDDFYEEDEPVEKIKKAFDDGRKTVTAQPAHSAAAGQTKYIATGVALTRSLSDSQAAAGRPQHR